MATRQRIETAGEIWDAAIADTPLADHPEFECPQFDGPRVSRTFSDDRNGWRVLTACMAASGGLITWLTWTVFR